MFGTYPYSLLQNMLYKHVSRIPFYTPNPILPIHLHLLALLPQSHLLDIHVPPDVALADDLLVQDGSGAPLEGVALRLGGPLVGLHVAPVQGGLLLGDDGDVDVGAGAQVVEDAGLDGLAAQLDGLVAREVGLPLGLEDGHGGEGAGAHGDVGQLVGAAVGVHGEEVGAGGVDAGHDQVRADVALVAEEVLLEEGHAGDDARLAARREGVELEVRGDDGGGELGVGGRAGARAPDLRRDVVELLAVLVCYYGAAGGSRICRNLEGERGWAASARQGSFRGVERAGEQARV